jgi:hypothetical protein
MKDFVNTIGGLMVELGIVVVLVVLCGAMLRVGCL